MDERTCSIDGCRTRHYARGWCIKHYARWQRCGNPLGLSRPAWRGTPEGQAWLDGLLVDPEDEHFLVEYNWSPMRRSNTTYAQTSYGPKVNGRRGKFLLHRLVMNAQLGQLVDHRNHNGSDNRRANLRIATPTGNATNRRKQADCSSQFKGVYWDKRRGKWHAQITVARRTHRLGLFSDEVEAAKAFDEVRRAFSGDFAYLNFRQIAESLVLERADS